MKKTFHAPKYLLPNENIINNWPVIACDQHSSNVDYWSELSQELQNKVTSLNLIVPEALYSDIKDWDLQFQKINNLSNDYLRNNILREFEEGIVVVKRTTESGNRLGVLLVLDLEDYDFTNGSNLTVTASENTDLERLNKRKFLRSRLDLEFSHTLVFFNDKTDKLLRPFRENKITDLPLYKLKLNTNGGDLEAFVLHDKKLVLDYFNNLSAEENHSFVVADGNHSLASAKEYWNSVKNELDSTEKYDNPYRYYMVELININDASVIFHPIHRIVHPVSDAFLNMIMNINIGNLPTKISINGDYHTIFLNNDIVESYKYIDQIIHDESKISNLNYDFIHGEEEAIKISLNNDNCLAIIMPTLPKNSFYSYLKKHKVLPKKSFSIGEAHEKRYYFEGRKLKKI